MSLSEVSNQYPEIICQMSPSEIRFYDIQDINVNKVVDYLIINDCWGLAICRKNSDQLEPKWNTYALYEKIGRSFGTSRLPNSQYEFEQRYRDQVTNNFDLILKELKIGDSLLIYMFGNEPWRVTMTFFGQTKTDSEYTFSFHKS